MKSQIADGRLQIGVVVALLAAVVLVARAQPPQAPAGEFAELSTLARSELKEINAPGAAIARVKGDRVVLRAGVGIANVESGQPPAPDGTPLSPPR